MLLGKPLSWGPNISFDDGKLDVCIIQAQRVSQYVRLIANALLGRHDRDPQVQYITATDSVIIKTEHPVPIQADGDLIGETPIHIKLVPQALRLIVPAGIGDR